VQEIRDQKDCKGLQSFVLQYLTQVEDIIYSPGVDYEKIEAPDPTFKIFQKTVLKQLEKGKDALMEDLSIVNPSTVTEVKNLLGCTEHCFWCGSLCWGQYGHESNCDDTKKHHACHQPRGLIGVRNKNKHYLVAHSCHEVGDGLTVYWGKFHETGMKWEEAMLHEDFVGWTFTLHSKTEFNDLMKWFFVQLHEKIAASRSREVKLAQQDFENLAFFKLYEKLAASLSREVKPAQQRDLEEKGFFKLPLLEHILATIRSRI